MITAPRTEFVTRKWILNCGAGITWRTLRGAIESGTLRPAKWPGKWMRFRWKDVVKTFGLE
jgi:hypothetical protein